MTEQIEHNKKGDSPETAQRKGQFIEVYNGPGTVSETCEAVGISRGTYYNWRRDDEAFHKTILELNEGQADRVENALVETALAGNVTAQIFYLKNNRKEIYGEKLDMNVHGELIHKMSELAKNARIDFEKALADECPNETNDQ